MEDLSKDQVVMLKRAFDAFDHDNKGCISTSMVSTILEMLDCKQSPAMLEQIIEELDDGSGTLEFEDFCELAAKFIVEVEEEDDEAMLEELREAFRLYDKEGNGYITTDVLKEIFSELEPNISSEDLDSMIEEIDADGSGTVDFEEFMEVMTGE